MKQTDNNIILSTDDLVKIYRGASCPAVDGVTLRVARGSIFGLLGPNGAGKTTTISILCTLLRPTAGNATILGYDVVRNAAVVRRKIGLVPQDIALYASLTARENLRYFARMLQVPKELIEDRIAESLQLVELVEYADQIVATFSGGMKRRINLAVSILHHPAILFLDEPTVGIDTQSRNLILERLVELKQRGMTLVYTTHYMEEAQQICDAVEIIDGGRVIATGRPEQLVAAADGCDNLEGLFLQLTGKQLRDRME